MKRNTLKWIRIALLVLFAVSVIAWRILWAFTAGWYEVAAILLAVAALIAATALPKEG